MITCLLISEPIEPPAPVIKTDFFSIFLLIKYLCDSTSSLPKRSEISTSFNSDTDTEVIPHLIQRELNTLSKLNLDKNGSTLLVAVRNVISDLEGSYALAVLWADAPTALVVARRQAPLIIGLGEGEFICASDTPAIANFTNISNKLSL